MSEGAWAPVTAARALRAADSTPEITRGAARFTGFERAPRPPRRQRRPELGGRLHNRDAGGRGLGAAGGGAPRDFPKMHPKRGAHLPEAPEFVGFPGWLLHVGSCEDAGGERMEIACTGLGPTVGLGEESRSPWLGDPVRRAWGTSAEIPAGPPPDPNHLASLAPDWANPSLLYLL